MAKDTGVRLAPYLYRDEEKISGVVVTGDGLRKGSPVRITMPDLKVRGNEHVWTGELNGGIGSDPTSQKPEGMTGIYMIGVRYQGSLPARQADDSTNAIRQPPGSEGGEIEIVVGDPQDPDGGGSEPGGNDPDPNNPPDPPPNP